MNAKEMIKIAQEGLVGKSIVQYYDKKLKNRANILDIMYTPEQQAEMTRIMEEYNEACSIVRMIVEMYDIQPEDIFDE